VAAHVGFSLLLYEVLNISWECDGKQLNLSREVCKVGEEKVGVEKGLRKKRKEMGLFKLWGMITVLGSSCS
jgi:hypothetical protein